MTGIEHYREAVKLMRRAEMSHEQAANVAAAYYLQLAQVHATLALSLAITAPINPKGPGWPRWSE